MSNSFNHWAAIADALIPACEQTVDLTAEQAVGHIQQQIEANGQVRTGEMRDSAYSKSQRGSTYKNSEHALPEIPAPDSSTEANVAMAAAHSIFQDMGTVYIPPRPFFNQGIENTRSDFDTNLEDLAKKLEEAGK